MHDQTAGAIVQDATGAILDFNDAATRLLEMSADVLSGRSSADPEWEAVDGDERPLAGDDHPAMVALRTRTAIEGAVIGVRVGSGAFRWLAVDAQIHEIDGRAVSVAQFTDITAQRIAEQRASEALSRLQQHALPMIRSDAAWVSVDSRYESVSPPLQIGGDFLDVFRIGDERLGFFIGDVGGHDLDAAATMVLAHHTLHAVGLHVRGPGRILTWLHDALTSHADAALCTAIYGDVTPAETGLVVRFANAGHPPPIRIGADGSASLVTSDGALLGVISPYVEPTDVEIVLAPGEQLLLYTDGLVESRRPRMTCDDLVAHLAARHPTDQGATMAFVDELMATSREQSLPAQDDTAVLVIAHPSSP